MGERAITSLILPKFCRAVGDDCAILGIGELDIVLTTDPVPDPAARVIGGDDDLYWVGRLLVTINASDLAAAGAQPLAFLSAIECSSDLEVDKFERLLRGITDGCEEEGLEYVGGNLKESPRLTATGVAMGSCERGKALHRKGAKDGQILLSVGQGGIFWRDALATREGRRVADKLASPLFRPSSQVRNMHALSASVPISVAMDNSDGLLATAAQLAAANEMGVIVDLEHLKVPEASFLGMDEARLWLGWGDWNVLIGTDASQVPRVKELAEKSGFPVLVIGEFRADLRGAFVKRGGEIREAPRLESERFAQDSWFTAGIDGYIKLLLGLDLPPPV